MSLFLNTSDADGIILVLSPDVLSILRTIRMAEQMAEDYHTQEITVDHQSATDDRPSEDVDHRFTSDHNQSMIDDHRLTSNDHPAFKVEEESSDAPKVSMSN